MRSLLRRAERAGVSATTPSATAAGCSSPFAVAAFDGRRAIRAVTPANHRGPLHYSTKQRFVAGQDVSLKHTEFYDGYTDDFGTYKDGPPQTLRLEYVRSPEHTETNTLLHRYLWSPFEAPSDMQTYTPLYDDWMDFSSRDYWGHRNGPAPGDTSTKMRGNFQRRDIAAQTNKTTVNLFPQRHVPKWLACIVQDKRRKRFVGFFLYANGAYCAELLTYKQLPRLSYNKPYNGCMPTVGQRVELSEVTYGKEVSQVESYPGHGAKIALAAGTAAVVLRGSDPNLIPLLLPSKEVRLFDKTATATFGRNAGVMQRQCRIQGWHNVCQLKPHRPKVVHKKKSVSSHNNGGGTGWKRNMQLRLDYREFPAFNCKTKYWLSGYIVKGRQYVKRTPVADLKSKTHGIDGRDPVYR